MAGSASLERRYRRLLRAYPAAHRAVHEREMLDQLMSASGAGQSRPDPVEAANLLWGAARLRMRDRRVFSPGPWRDALAVFSVAVPVVLAVATIVGTAAFSYRYLAAPPGLQFGRAWADHPASWRYLHAVLPALGFTLAYLAGPGSVLLVVLAVAVLARLRRLAAAVTALSIAAAIGDMVWLASHGITGPVLHFGGFAVQVDLSDPQMVLYTIFYLVELVALLASPGPRRGRQLLGRRHAGYLALAALPVSLGFLVSAMDPGAVIAAAAAAVSAGCVVVVARRAGRTRVGRRLALLTWLACYLLAAPAPINEAAYYGLLPRDSVYWAGYLGVPLLSMLALAVALAGGLRGLAGRMHRSNP